MRIVSGIFKGKTFQPDKRFSARPTTDFARESLFNILANQLDFQAITALDLFSGTGAVSLELISRGCRAADAVELDRVSAANIQKIARNWGIQGLRVIQQDVFQYVQTTRRMYHFIFADPPYELPQLAAIPDAVLQRPQLLADGGLFVLEHPRTADFSGHPLLVDHRKYGNVHFSFFRKSCDDSRQSPSATS